MPYKCWIQLKLFFKIFFKTAAGTGLHFTQLCSYCLSSAGICEIDADIFEAMSRVHRAHCLRTLRDLEVFAQQRSRISSSVHLQISERSS